MPTCDFLFKQPQFPWRQKTSHVTRLYTSPLVPRDTPSQIHYNRIHQQQKTVYVGATELSLVLLYWTISGYNSCIRAARQSGNCKIEVRIGTLKQVGSVSRTVCDDSVTSLYGKQLPLIITLTPFSDVTYWWSKLKQILTSVHVKEAEIVLTVTAALC